MVVDIFQSFDELDEAHGERVGAPQDAISELVRSLENHLVAMPATSAEALAWKMRRLTRAIENDWRESEVSVIVSSIERDVASMAA